MVLIFETGIYENLFIKKEIVTVFVSYRTMYNLQMKFYVIIERKKQLIFEGVWWLLKALLYVTKTSTSLSQIIVPGPLVCSSSGCINNVQGGP